jgi:hypothetical protein
MPKGSYVVRELTTEQAEGMKHMACCDVKNNFIYLVPSGTW